MGNRLRHQRRGRGTPKYRATKKGAGVSEYITFDSSQKDSLVRGEVTGLINDSARTGILMEATFENGLSEYVIAAEGSYVGQPLEYGKNAKLAIGNAKPLGDIVEGCPVFNIEKVAGDGGSLARTSGSYALVVTKDAKFVYLKMPSGKTVKVRPECRATVGCAAAGGRKEKPLVKAGTNFHRMKARKKRYPGLRGVAMNPIDHPFGGSQHHPGKSKSTKRSAPAGRKVGAIASKRTGRRKKN